MDTAHVACTLRTVAAVADSSFALPFPRIN